MTRVPYLLVALGPLLAAEAGAQASAAGSSASQPTFEIVARAGVVQPVGELAPQTPIAHVVGPGAAMSFGFGYRLTPRLGVVLASEFDESSVGSPELRGASLHGFAVSGLVSYTPSSLGCWEPRLSLGLGYRVLWESLPSGGSVVTHGPELARAELAMEYRLTRLLSLGPFAGADLDFFAWQAAAGAGTQPLERTVVNAFFSAGVGGRFDFASTGSSATTRRSEPRAL